MQVLIYFHWEAAAWYTETQIAHKIFVWINCKNKKWRRRLHLNWRLIWPFARRLRVRSWPEGVRTAKKDLTLGKPVNVGRACIAPR